MKDSVTQLQTKCRVVAEVVAKSIVANRGKVDAVMQEYDAATYKYLFSFPCTHSNFISRRVMQETDVNKKIRSIEEDISTSAAEAAAWRVQVSLILDLFLCVLPLYRRPS